MALSDKDILITPNSGSSTDDPKIEFTGATSSSSSTITVSAIDLDGGTLSFEGSAGQLFSVTNNLTSGSIFSVNDVSGVPSIDVNSDGTILLAPFETTPLIGIGKTNPDYALDIKGTTFGGPFVGNSTLATFDPPGGGTGTDTATEVAFAFGSGQRIAGYTNGYIRTLLKWDASADLALGQGGTTLIGGINLLPGSNGVAKVNGSRILTIADEGAGNSMDADTVDTLHASSFLRSDANSTATGQITLSGGVSSNGKDFYSNNGAFIANDADGAFATRTGSNIDHVWHNDSTNTWHFCSDTTYKNGGNSIVYAGSFSAGGSTVWHAGNDGAGSGLDADTIDGIQADRIPYGSNNLGTTANTNTAQNLRSGFFDVFGTANNAPTNTWYSFINIRHTNSTNGWGHQIAGSFYDNGDLYNRHYDSGSYAGWTKIWNAANDGAGSGLDADLLDGSQKSAFVCDRGSALGASTSWDITEPGMYGVVSSSTYTGTNNPESAIPGIYRYGVLTVFEANGNGLCQLYTPHTGNKIALRTGWNNGGWYPWQQVWTSTSDGAGSGLDADNLDGYTWATSGKNVRADDFYADNWFRNYNAGEGLYNEATGCHFVSDGTDQWTVRDAGNSIRIEFKTNGTTRRASLYADNASSIGFLNAANQWGLRYYSNDGTSPNLYFLEEGNETWSGNPGNDIGKIEYHSNRFYIAAGANSTEVCVFRRSGSDIVRISNSGAITASNNVTAFSDINLKKNIEVIPNALDKVSQIRGVTFDRIDIDDEPRQSGVIAQEVEAVLPEVVRTAQDGTKTVAYGNMVGVLIEAIKEQQKQIDDLKAKLEEGN